MKKVVLQIYAFALLGCAFFFRISASSTNVLVVTIFGVICKSTYLFTCSLAESPVKNLTRIQLLTAKEKKKVSKKMALYELTC